jgi:ectoine hydroxylase-related dioxygenase (phytanoyl-CoA dioxygenase family)
VVWQQPFVELHPTLVDLIADDRIYSPIRDLLGEDFVWVGSEGMYGFSEQLRDHHWHSDGDKDVQKLAYKLIKVMLFLDPLRRESGALRVIPGSHRLPLYKALVPFQDVHANEHPTFFGQEGAEIPAYAVETDPGDMVLFNQWLSHAAYGKTGHRRTIVLKFAAGPVEDGHLAMLGEQKKSVFKPHEALQQSANPRIRQMAERGANLEPVRHNLQGADILVGLMSALSD